MGSNICPQCFTRSDPLDAHGPCQACGYNAWRSNLHLWFGLAGCLFTLLALILGAVFTYYFRGYHL